MWCTAPAAEVAKPAEEKKEEDKPAGKISIHDNRLPHSNGRRFETATLPVIGCERDTAESTSNGRFKIKHRLRLVSYNVLNAALGIRPRHGPIDELKRTWAVRHPMLVNELRHYLSDVVVLQEVSLSMAADLETSLSDLGYRLYRPTENLGETEAHDLSAGRYESHAPATFVRVTSDLQVVGWHVLKLTEVPFPMSRDSEAENGLGTDLIARYMEVCQDARAVVVHLRLFHRNSTGDGNHFQDVIIGNVHLHHDPFEPHIKALQMCAIANHLRNTADRVQGRRPHIIIAGDFNSAVRKTTPDAFDQPRDGLWDGVSPLPSGVYELLDRGILKPTHPDHPVNRMPSAVKRSYPFEQLSLGGESFVSVYKLANGKEPCVTTKCVDFAATLDYIFVSSSAVQNQEIKVLTTLSMPYNDHHESNLWLGEAAVASVIPELGVSIPNSVFPSDHLAIGCDLIWPSSSKRLRVIAVGAADTFFKVGHYALRKLSTDADVECIRLALPTVEEAKKACHGIPGIEFTTWKLDDLTTLQALSIGFNALILVPPLDGKCVSISESILKVAEQCGIMQVVCISGQKFGKHIYPRPYSNQIEELCRQSKVPLSISIRLPFFLENLLWHTTRIVDSAAFQYPCLANDPFPYITCRDVGEAVAHYILSPSSLSEMEVDKKDGEDMSKHRIVEFSYRHTTTMAFISEYLSKQLGHAAPFYSCSFEEFSSDLERQRITFHGAQEMSALWSALATSSAFSDDAMAEANRSRGQACDELEHLLGRSAMSVESWIDEHICCFQANVVCKHALPPKPHQAPERIAAISNDSARNNPNVVSSLENIQPIQSALSLQRSFSNVLVDPDSPPPPQMRVRFTHLTGLRREVSSVVFSCDGLWIAASCNSELHDDGQVLVWSGSTGKICRTLGEGPYRSNITSVLCLCFMVINGQYLLVTGNQDRRICIWDMDSWELRVTLCDHEREITALTSTPSGISGIGTTAVASPFLISTSADLNVRVWRQHWQESTDGRGVKSDVWSCVHICTKDTSITSVAFWSEAQLFVTALSTLNVIMWDVRTGVEVREVFTAHEDVILSLCFFNASKNTMMATSSKDKTVRIFDACSGVFLRALNGHTDYVRSVVADVYSCRLATGSDDGKIMMWCPVTGICEGIVSAGSEVRMLSCIVATKLRKKSSIFVSGLRSGSLKLWYVSDVLEDSRKSKVFTGPTDWVQCVALSSDGSRVFSGSDDGNCRVWDALTSKLIFVRNCGSVVRTVACSSNGDCFVAGGGATFDPRSSKPPPLPILIVFTMLSSGFTPTFSLEGHTQTVRSVSMSSSSEFIVSASDDAQVLIWNGKSGTLLFTLNECKNSVRAVSLSQSSRLIAAGCWDMSILLWKMTPDLSSPIEYMASLCGHSSPVRTVSLSADDELLASGSFDDIRLWKVTTQECIMVIKDHIDPIDSVILFSKWILSASHNARIKIHCIVTGECVRTLIAHTSGVTSLSVVYNFDNVLLVSGSRDHTVRLWQFTLDCDEDILVEALKVMDPSSSGVLRRAFAMHSLPAIQRLVDLTLNYILEADHEHNCLWHRFIGIDEFEPIVRILVHRKPTLASVVHPVKKRSSYDLASGRVRSAMNDILYFCGQYKLVKTKPVHRSSTCVVLLASDMNNIADVDEADLESDTVERFSQEVVIKLMKCNEQFLREMVQRSDLDARFVVPILFHSDSPRAIDRWTADITSAGFAEYTHGFVMEAAQRNLMVVIAQERLSVDDVRNIMLQIAICLLHLHENGRIHGDFKPLNAVRMKDGRTWKLIDLDASVNLNDKVGSKVSTAYAPPEILVQSGVCASVSFDMWSFGVVLYHMLIGKSLFHSDNDGTLANDDEVTRVLKWDDDVFNEELGQLSLPNNSRNRAAKNLLSWLLSKDPKARPQSMSDVIEHCFFQSDATAGFMRQGVGYFISHAQESGGQQARSLKRQLAEMCPILRKSDCGHLEDPIWLDVDEIPLKENMLKGVRRCANFLVFLSKGSLKRWFTQLEIRQAMRLRKNIILVSDEPSSEPVYGGYVEFQHYLDDAAAGDDIIIDGNRGNSSSLFASHVAIPFIHRPEFASVSLKLILEAGGYTFGIPGCSRMPSNENIVALKQSITELIDRYDFASALTRIKQCLDSNASPSQSEILYSITSPDIDVGTLRRVLVVYDPVCEQTMVDFRLLLEDSFPSLKGCVMLAGQMRGGQSSALDVIQFSNVIIFLTNGILRNSTVLDILRSRAMECSNPRTSAESSAAVKVHYMHATDKRHRAAACLEDIVLNESPDKKTPDFGITVNDVDRRLLLESVRSSSPTGWGDSIPFYSQQSVFRTVSIQLVGSEILQANRTA